MKPFGGKRVSTDIAPHSCVSLNPLDSQDSAVFFDSAGGRPDLFPQVCVTKRSPTAVHPSSLLVLLKPFAGFCAVVRVSEDSDAVTLGVASVSDGQE